MKQNWKCVTIKTVLGGDMRGKHHHHTAKKRWKIKAKNMNCPREALKHSNKVIGSIPNIQLTAVRNGGQFLLNNVHAAKKKCTVYLSDCTIIHR